MGVGMTGSAWVASEEAGPQVAVKAPALAIVLFGVLALVMGLINVGVAAQQALSGSAPASAALTFSLLCVGGLAAWVYQLVLLVHLGRRSDGLRWKLLVAPATLAAAGVVAGVIASGWASGAERLWVLVSLVGPALAGAGILLTTTALGLCMRSLQRAQTPGFDERPLGALLSGAGALVAVQYAMLAHWSEVVGLFAGTTAPLALLALTLHAARGAEPSHELDEHKRERLWGVGAAVASGLCALVTAWVVSRCDLLGPHPSAHAARDAQAALSVGWLTLVPLALAFASAVRSWAQRLVLVSILVWFALVLAVFPTAAPSIYGEPQLVALGGNQSAIAVLAILAAAVALGLMSMPRWVQPHSGVPSWWLALGLLATVLLCMLVVYAGPSLDSSVYAADSSSWEGLRAIAAGRLQAGWWASVGAALLLSVLTMMLGLRASNRERGRAGARGLVAILVGTALVWVLLFALLATSDRNTGAWAQTVMAAVPCAFGVYAIYLGARTVQQEQATVEVALMAILAVATVAIALVGSGARLELEALVGASRRDGTAGAGPWLMLLPVLFAAVCVLGTAARVKVLRRHGKQLAGVAAAAVLVVAALWLISDASSERLQSRSMGRSHASLVR